MNRPMEQSNNNSIESIWIKYYDQLLNFILKRVSDKATAEDILQNVFLKIISNIDTLHDSTKLKNWLFQITRNAIIDHFRKPIKTESIYSDLPEEADEKESELMEEVGNWISPFIGRLPKKYQEALNLSELDGMSQKDLATHLGISYSGAKARVQRGRAMLKKELMECCHFHSDKYGSILDVNPKTSDCDNCND
jgi:RNA polymerase sigma-70 factor (ECF subfamily)